MKLKIFIYLIILLIPCGCINPNKAKDEEETPLDTIETLNNQSSAFDPMVEEGIEELIQYIEGENFLGDLDPVYGIVFYKENKNEFIGMSAQPFYLKEQIIAYTYFDNRTIVYYGDTVIGNKFVDINKMQFYTDTLPGFVDYHDMPPAIYEPYGILYRIVSPDSLLMIHKGMI